MQFADQEPDAGPRVTEVMRYDTKFGLLGKLLDRLGLRSTTEKGIGGFLAGLAKTVTDEARMAWSVARRSSTAAELFWDLIEELRAENPAVEEGTIMGARCVRVRGEFLALVDFKNSGLVVKLPRSRVDELIEQGVGQPFAPAGKVFREWVAIPTTDARRWLKLLREGVAFVSKQP